MKRPLIDPKPRRDKRCYLKECRKPLPKIALLHGDAFCTTACAKRYFGVVNATERPIGAVSTFG